MNTIKQYRSASKTGCAPSDHKPITAFNDPAFQQWMKDVAALPAEKQVQAVAEKLQELNPGFNGKVTGGEGQGTPRIENGAVTGFGFCTDKVTDISPVRALGRLRSLCCAGTPFSDKGKFSDLSLLKGLPLTELCCESTKVSDLSPLKAMRLTGLRCYCTPVSDLSPVKGMPLTYLICGNTPVSDLSPLKGMPLTCLHCDSTRVSDLSPLEGMNLTVIAFSPKNITKGMDVIRRMKSLKTIANNSWAGKDQFWPAEFWKKYDAGEINK